MPRTTSLPHDMVTTAELRVPTQQRGTRRVETILDAAAQLVTEVGVEGITVQLLADRASTSKGSLYHFFPDVPAVLRALADRHFAEITAIVDAIVHDESIDWHGVPTSEVVSRLLAPLDYLGENCDLLALVRAPGVLDRSARSLQPMLKLVNHILAARYPDMQDDRRAARTAMLVAVIDGVVATASRGCALGAVELRRELDDLLASYVTSFS